MTVRIETVNAHPGIFAVGDAPKGIHVDGQTGTATEILSCNQRLPAEPGACPVRTAGQPARLVVTLSGSELFACNPCAGSPLIFELAPVVGGVAGTYVPLTLNGLVSVDIGVEKATIVLRADTAPGEHLLRVHNTLRPETSTPLKVEFGQPAG